MPEVKNRRGLIIFEGIIFLLLGILAVALPGFSTLSVELFIGWLLFFSGLVQGYRAFKTRSSPDFWGALITGALYVIFGALLVIFPIAGIISLTLLITFFFILEGIAKIFLGFQLRPFSQWGLFILNGILALIMAGIIFAGWPGSAFWVIGLLVGINMIFFGLSLLFLGFNLPKEDSTNPQ